MENLIKNAYKYYDKMNTEFKLDNVEYTETDKYESDLLLPRIKLKLKNGKEYNCNYTILGTYQNNNNKYYFKWGWSSNELKNKIYLTRELLKYGLDMTENESDQLKKLLINSLIEISNYKALEIITVLSLYLTKCQTVSINESTIYLYYNIKEI
tara:strand:- start:1184 stop:1645 length:462 start_codon:yes stop_codon:yes gene_type:complete